MVLCRSVMVQSADMKKIKRAVTEVMTPHCRIQEILRWVKIILDHRREVTSLDGIGIVVDTYAVRKLSSVKLWKMSYDLKKGITAGLKEVYGEGVNIKFS